MLGVVHISRNHFCCCCCCCCYPIVIGKDNCFCSHHYHSHFLQLLLLLMMLVLLLLLLIMLGKDRRARPWPFLELFTIMLLLTLQHFSSTKASDKMMKTLIILFNSRCSCWWNCSCCYKCQFRCQFQCWCLINKWFSCWKMKPGLVITF